MNRSPFLLQATVVVLALTVTACASPGGSSAISGRANLSPEERRLQDAENKLAAFQRRLDAMDSLRSAAGGQTASRDELRQMLGDLEQIKNELRQIDQRGRQQYLDLDQRLRLIEGAGAPASGVGFGVLAPTPPLSELPPSSAASTTAPVTPAPAPARAAASGPVDPDEETHYLATFELLKNGKYDEAVSGFRAHLERYPNGSYADNAAYWMAEASFVKRDYRTAATAFQRVVDQHPTSQRAPDALFKLALTQAELNQTTESRATLRQVVERYPNSNAAKLAQQRLSGN